MSQSLTCDNCGKTIADTDEERTWWFKVGWFDAGAEHACSAGCGHALLEEFVSRRWEIEQEIEAERAELARVDEEQGT